MGQDLHDVDDWQRPNAPGSRISGFGWGKIGGVVAVKGFLMGLYTYLLLIAVPGQEDFLCDAPGIGALVEGFGLCDVWTFGLTLSVLLACFTIMTPSLLFTQCMNSTVVQDPRGAWQKEPLTTFMIAVTTLMWLCLAAFEAYAFFMRVQAAQGIYLPGVQVDQPNVVAMALVSLISMGVVILIGFGTAQIIHSYKKGEL